ncbi:hypothetical protein LCGC14_0792080 [marine sediment metagenome]|uniref:Uncharacterized protein n=1 Tax=marine sediment metagenome TaxID=412755 RepID=A0A0F9SZD6_9ZZZZ
MSYDVADIFLKFMSVLLIVSILLFIISIPLMVYDSMYINPIAQEKANEYCQEQGFDFYKEYSRIGFLSKEPIAVICKYVEQYRNIDLNIIEAKE